MSSLPSSAGRNWPAIAASDFGEPFDAFPVEAPFTVKPDLVKLAPCDDWLRVDRQWPEMVAAKLAALAGDDRQPGAPNIMLASACSAEVEQRRIGAVRQACERLAATAAGRRLGIACADEAVSFAAAGYLAHTAAPASEQLAAGDAVHLQPQRPDAAPVVQALVGAGNALRLLGALAMSLQEDLVVMEQGPEGAAKAALFHVSFPSAWNPAAKLGQDLLALHAPVADNRSLQAAAARLGQALLGKGPFVRWVWTVTTESGWRAWRPDDTAGHERHAGEARDVQRDPLYFRLERQTTMPLGGGYGLFLIRVRVAPLDEVLAKTGRLALLQASLRSMSDEMVRYKNLAGVRDRILER
jgi:hypothetical protein